MAQFGKSLGNLALAATVTFAPMPSNAADVSKLSDEVVANCKAASTLALADFRAKIDAAAPTSTQELTDQRNKRYAKNINDANENCLEIAALKATSAELSVREAQADARITQADARSEEARARSAQARARSAELDISHKALTEIDTALTAQLAFFQAFINGEKTAAEYKAQIASLPTFVENVRERINIARTIYSNNPSMTLSLNNTEIGLKKVLAFTSSFQTRTTDK